MQGQGATRQARVGIYNQIMRLVLPGLLAVMVVQRLRGRLGPGALHERLGLGPSAPADIWLHGASVGELTSARPLIGALTGARPGLRLIVTCNSETARAMVKGWALPGIAAVLAPLDTPGSVARFLSRMRPRALVTLESEIWPARIARMAQEGPVIGVAARLSARSARAWARFAPGLLRDSLGRMALISPQDAESGARFVSAGLPPDRLAPPLMLKALVMPQALPAPFPPPAPREATLLAASTHEGEEIAILEAFVQQRATGPFRHLILAPRHPHRGPSIAAQVRTRGLTLAQRALGEVPGPETAVHLADTLGEMPAWYAMAGVTIIGGTFADKGGHTPYEPAAFGSAILCGPSVHNFAEPFAALDAAKAALRVADPRDLAPVLAGLTAARQGELAARAPLALHGTSEEISVLAARILALMEGYPEKG